MHRACTRTSSSTTGRQCSRVCGLPALNRHLIKFSSRIGHFTSHCSSCLTAAHCELLDILTKHARLLARGFYIGKNGVACKAIVGTRRSGNSSPRS